MKGTVKIQMFNLPNFLKIDAPGASADAGSLDVAHLFPDDQSAREFWDDCKARWVEHVAKRRASEGKSERVP